MTTGTNVRVLVDGVQAADGCEDTDFSGPVVLDNLSVTWGRSDTMSQPEADTCTFEIMDASGEGFMQQFRTGSRIDVLASGVVDETANTPTFTNPDFESSSVTWATAGGTAERTTQRAFTGSYSLNVRPGLSTAPVAVILAPAPFSAPGEDPDAWDDIPTTQLAETWTLSAALWIPTGASAQILPVLFSGPYVASAVLVPEAPLVIAGSDGWHTFTWEITIEQEGPRWVGMQVMLSPVGRAWDEMPPALTWDEVDPSLSWDDFGTLYVDAVQAISPATPSAASVLVFSGRVTELSAAWDDAANAPVVAVTANGFTADLENRRVGDEPWPVEDVDARSHRILELAGLPISIDVDTSIDETLLSWRDVDSQGALGLLQSIATSVDAVLWPAVHVAIGAYLRMEDPAMRPSLLRLVEELGPPPRITRTNHATNPDAEAFGAVATVRTNWVGNPVPANLTGYSRAGTVASTVTFETTGGPTASGGAWIKNAITNATAGTDNQINVGAQVTGQFRHASGWFWSSKAISLRVAAWTYDATGVYLGSSNDITTPNFSVPANTWTYYQGALSVPPVAYARFQSFVRVVSASPVISPDIYGVASLTFSDGVGAPFNGATPAAGDFTYAWTGTANASTSVQRAPAATGVSAFSGGNAARYSSVVEHYSGSRAFAVLPVVAAQTGLIWNLSPRVVLAGEWVSAYMFVKAAVGVKLAVSIRTAAGAGAGAVALTGTGDWQVAVCSAQASANGDLIGAQVVNVSPYQLGVPFYADRIIVTVGSAPYTGEYFDGRTPDTSAFAYDWTGPADASTSTETTVQTRTIVIEEVDPNSGATISACDILRDPVTWIQSVADVATRSSVTWKLQGVDEEGNPTTTDVTEYVIDEPLEERHGTRSVSVSTELQSQADARSVAGRVLARTSSDAWRAGGLTIDDEDLTPGEDTELLLYLLDGTSRIGLPIVLTDLPVWTPGGTRTGTYLEGGTYSFVGGRWVLALTVSSANSGLGASAAWDELDPSWQWDHFDPDITWNDLRGVSA